MKFNNRAILLLSVFLTVFVSISLAQSEQEVKKELDKRGITTKDQILLELRKRGMSEDDARRQARLYGLDYDEYIAKYISNKADTISVPQSIQKIEFDTVGFAIETASDKARKKMPDTVKTVSDELPYYGYSIFENNPFANEQALVGNIDPGYLIGPGDQLRVYLWGEAEFQFEGQVDINGNLFIPNVGQVFVAGTSYEALGVRMREFLSKFYSGLKKDPPKIFLDVSLTKLRPIRIVVMGESQNPGSLLINSFATTLNSLYSSGGIKKSGTLREIKVFRNNRFISSVDLYDYLVKGALSEDLRLTNNDVIFIPTRLNSIKLKGEVNRPAIYELKGNEGLIDLVGFAGGLKPSAYTETVTIKRIRSIGSRSNRTNFDRELISIKYDSLLSNGINFLLQDGDEITFGEVLDKYDNLVTITGSVFRSGDYQLTQGQKVSDLINYSGGVRPNTYLEKADIYRRDKNGDLKFLSFSLKDVLSNKSSSQNLILQADDSVKIYNTEELKTLETVSIEGFLDEPKTVLWRKDLSLYDLIFMSAQVEDLEYRNRILTSRADLLRYEAGKTDYLVIPFNLDEVLDKKFNAVLQPKDRVILYSKDIVEVLDKYVFIQGAVKNEGKFFLTDSMSVEDLIIQSGGFLKTSFRESVTVSRENFDFSGNRIAFNTVVDLDLDYLIGNKRKASSNYILQDNDRISVNYIPGSSEQRVIKLVGEIKFPGTYFLESKSEMLSDIIVRAGGLSPNVYLPAARIYRDGQQLALDFQKVIGGQNPKFDIILQDNDSIYFPESFYTVRVEGEVANPALQKFTENKSVRSYIRNAGGITREGQDIFLTKPNGFTRKVGFLSSPKVDDGSVITVSAKPPKKPRQSGKFLETFGTIAAIISSTLTTVVLVQTIK
uniref:SLBB domain-containing protein n=1 Tax=Roseivirga sp. TaxID=1964215 RepID=UPI004048B944